MEKITSKSNTIIKDTNRLFTSSKARNENHLFALEGARLCFDVLNSVYEVDTLLYTEDIYSRYPDEIDALAKKSDRVYVITNDVAQKLTQTKSAQGVFLTVKAKDEQKNFINSGYRIIIQPETAIILALREFFKSFKFIYINYYIN